MTNLSLLAKCGIVLAVLLIGKGLYGPGDFTSQTNATAIANPQKPARSFRPIQQIRVGQRVITNVPPGILDIDGQPFDLSRKETCINPATWRRIRMRAQEIWDDGTIDDINIDTLQPHDWIAKHGVAIGQSAPIPFDLVEMGLDESLAATVCSIEPCPAIEIGPGDVVITTVDHLNRAICELMLVDRDANFISLQSTSAHKFYNHSQATWVNACELKPGDILDCGDSRAIVVNVRPKPGVKRVYNFTVESPHVYRVSPAAILVHNANCGQRHHPISKKVHRALEEHPILQGAFEYRDPRYVTQAANPSGHRGYQSWHRQLDDEVADFIRRNSSMTHEEFVAWLRSRYAQQDLIDRFPDGF